MSIFKVNKSDYQSVTLTTTPTRYYQHSSSAVIGTIQIFPRLSKVEKDIPEFDDPNTPFVENKLFNKIEEIKKNFSKNITNFFLEIDGSGYLQDVNLQVKTEKNKVIEIERFTPDVKRINKSLLKKIFVRKVLSDYYRPKYPSAHWAYPNYHSLNFFKTKTTEDSTKSSVLLYPNDDDNGLYSTPGYASGRYNLNDAFSFDFYINPRYNHLDSKGHFKAGTIFHLSSSYVLSLLTGSQKGIDGLSLGFRLQLQLSHSADVSPSSAIYGGYPNDLIFLSDDNSLLFNNWHHVVVRWGSNTINNGIGSFNIDGVDKGTFLIPSSSLLPKAYTGGMMDPSNPDALAIGNYYEGNNTGNDALKKFFSGISSDVDGVISLDESEFSIDRPENFKFDHQLQAELHNISIKKTYLDNFFISASSSLGPDKIGDSIFYLPPFFTMDSPIRIYDQVGGVLQTPAISISGMSTTPFNIPMAFGVDGHYINTENFLKDFSSNHHPKQIFLSASIVDYNNAAVFANDVLYSQPAVRKRNLLILPCDDGNFYPNYDLLINQKTDVFHPLIHPNGFLKLQVDPKYYSYVDDFKVFNPGLITLNFSLSSSLYDSQITEKQEFDLISELIGFQNPSDSLRKEGKKFIDYMVLINQFVNNLSDTGPKTLFDQQGEIPLAIPNKTGETSSNQVTLFDISNLFYGNRILPGSFTITDSALSGSEGKISITIKDDGSGGLYRADSATPHCKWNSVGTIFYEEGIVVIKNPHLYFFGKEIYEISFKGEQNLHTLRIEPIAPVNHLNSSSNPSFRKVPSTNYANEKDSDFVYITGINFHDDNLNVVMKTQLAQPIMKRHSEKIMFKVKYDF